MIKRIVFYFYVRWCWYRGRIPDDIFGIMPNPAQHEIDKRAKDQIDGMIRYIRELEKHG